MSPTCTRFRLITGTHACDRTIERDISSGVLVGCGRGRSRRMFSRLLTTLRRAIADHSFVVPARRLSTTSGDVFRTRSIPECTRMWMHAGRSSRSPRIVAKARRGIDAVEASRQTLGTVSHGVPWNIFRFQSPRGNSVGIGGSASVGSVSARSDPSCVRALRQLECCLSRSFAPARSSSRGPASARTLRRRRHQGGYKRPAGTSDAGRPAR